MKQDVSVWGTEGNNYGHLRYGTTINRSKLVKVFEEGAGYGVVTTGGCDDEEE